MSHSNGPLTRYVKLSAVHVPGKPGTFSPPPTSTETACWRSRHALRRVRNARVLMHGGITNPLWRENVPGIPGACTWPPGDPAMHYSACVTHVSWQTFLAFPGHTLHAINVSGKRPLQYVWTLFVVRIWRWQCNSNNVASNVGDFAWWYAVATSCSSIQLYLCHMFTLFVH